MSRTKQPIILTFVGGHEILWRVSHTHTHMVLGLIYVIGHDLSSSFLTLWCEAFPWDNKIWNHIGSYTIPHHSPQGSAILETKVPRLLERVRLLHHELHLMAKGIIALLTYRDFLYLNKPSTPHHTASTYPMYYIHQKNKHMSPKYENL